MEKLQSLSPVANRCSDTLGSACQGIDSQKDWMGASSYHQRTAIGKPLLLPLNSGEVVNAKLQGRNSVCYPTVAMFKHDGCKLAHISELLDFARLTYYSPHHSPCCNSSRRSLGACSTVQVPS